MFNKNKGVEENQLKPNYVYLYTCFSFLQINNPDVVDSIRAVKKNIQSHWDKGTTKTNLNTDLGTLKVWFKKSGIANIPSFDKAEQVYPITHDYLNQVFVVHTNVLGSNDGKVTFKWVKEVFPYCDFSYHEDSLILVNTIG